ncbi:DUF4183 domain-containing protein [Robertmurraya massiliosenegalensis]|uniref:DUF4183 domain-containing protein n=1 Tax=Robertmurraya massiliosenegalensis TaxID=1287657 RepID=UPI0002EF025C|nr:DUF4183 domain-containing protein [Robertmurraya massiliosenegalensis]
MVSQKNTRSRTSSKPYLTIPTVPSIKSFHRVPKKVKVYEYFAISNGDSKVFKEEDGLVEIGKQEILEPSKVSYMNLFINGVLQPKESYEVANGEITLKTEDMPPKGAPVILQMFIF